MDWAPALIAAIVAGFGMWIVTGVQHRLYTKPEHRVPGDSGGRRWIRRGGIALAAGLCAALAFRPGHYDLLPAIATAGAAAGLLLIASTDLERRLIPNRVSYVFFGVAVAVCWVWPDRDWIAIAAGIGAALGFGVAIFVLGELFAVALKVRATPFGIGDVKLMIIIGALLGWPGLVPALVIGIIAAGVPGVVLTLAGQGRRVFAYGPFLVFGALIPLLWPDRFV